MELAGSKLRRLESGTPVFIAPPPEFAISFEDDNCVMIECPEQRTDNDVLDWIAFQRGGKWIMKLDWIITLDGIKTAQPNPHQNGRGLWVYLVRRA